MPRDLSGIYTLPSGNPVIPGTIIDADWANPTLQDIAVQLNQVLTRDGLLGPIEPLKIVNGTVGFPGLAFAAEPTTGIYKSGPGTWNLSVLGTAAIEASAALISIKKQVSVNIGTDVVAFYPNATTGPSVQWHAGSTDWRVVLNKAADTWNIATNGIDRLIINNTGHIGVGVIPSPWLSSARVIQLKSGTSTGTGGSLCVAGTNDELIFTRNTYLDGGSWKRIGSGFAGIYQQGSDGSHLWLTGGSGAADSVITWGTHLTILSNGNVGISHSSPIARLDVIGVGATMGARIAAPGGGVVGLRVEAQNLSVVDIVPFSAHVAIGTPLAQPLTFQTNSVERLRIHQDGYMMFNTTGIPDNGLYTFSYFGSSTNGIDIIDQATGGAPIMLMLNCAARTLNNNNHVIQFTEIGVLRFAVKYNGGVANFQAFNVNLSDRGLKEDIKDAPSMLDKVRALRVCSFRYKGTEKVNLGVIAQEVSDVAPEWVTEVNPETLGVYSTDMQYALLRAVQELADKVDALEEQ